MLGLRVAVGADVRLMFCHAQRDWKYRYNARCPAPPVEARFHQGERLTCARHLAAKRWNFPTIVRLPRPDGHARWTAWTEASPAYRAGNVRPDREERLR